jgi:hypothetical protein
MTDRPLQADALDRLLVSLEVAFPPTPDISGAVAERLAHPAGGRATRRSPLRLALLAAVVVLLLAAGAVAAGAFGVGPLRILFGDALPSPNVPGTPLGTRLSLGERLTLAEAAANDDLQLHMPAGLGEPDEVYLSDIGIVSMLWAPRDGLPAMAGSGVGLLLMEIPGDLDPGLVSKVVVESRASVEPVTLRGTDGFWISGAPHVFRYFAPDGEDGAVTSRLVGDALVWQERDAVIRIESGVGRDATLALAASVTDWP